MVDADYPHRTSSTKGGSATIRSLFLAALFNALPGREVELDGLLHEHGVLGSQVSNPYERLPLHRYVSLVESAAMKFARPFLGLEMGVKFGLADLGPFHALLTSSGDLRDALATFSRFQSRWQTQTLFSVERLADATSYSYRIDDPAIWPRRQDAEFTIAGLMTLVKQLTTAKWSPVEVHFEHSVANREKHLRNFFRAPVLGSQPSNRLVILNEDLDRPFSRSDRSGDDRLKTILETHLLHLMPPDPVIRKSVAKRTAEIIARRLGQSSIDCNVVASDLKMSVRSLRRRLVEEGTSFRRVLQETRQARAEAMLEDTEVPLAAAAKVLGYSDTATFSRAFKQWTGAAPRHYGRKEL
ncbi:AraC family transcriptional regulator [Nitratireductor sp. ZSWI3]|uniref:AraC family transcriptional regulator n=1 Tax=Nitratireductor sp. ZSWI3 TaxID=2966359 RepID=UPI002150488B|nr:AraC family transcriptional regulator [Nitratireductor sp. ZSWI3]MCR4267583.1 AraC family transcriptional regulator [Nitratireductor sp. ZSWI3]